MTFTINHKMGNMIRYSTFAICHCLSPSYPHLIYIWCFNFFCKIKMYWANLLIQCVIKCWFQNFDSYVNWGKIFKIHRNSEKNGISCNMNHWNVNNKMRDTFYFASFAFSFIAGRHFQNVSVYVLQFAKLAILNTLFTFRNHPFWIKHQNTR